MRGRKALSMPMEIIIAVVVLVVIALAVIMFTTGGLTKGGQSTQGAQDAASQGLVCQTQATTWCAQHTDKTECKAISGECDKCKSTVSCGRT